MGFGRLEDAYRQPSLLVPVFQTDLLSRYIFHGFKNPRLFALRASRLSDGFSFIANLSEGNGEGPSHYLTTRVNSGLASGALPTVT